MICFSIFAMPSFVSPLFQIMPSLYIQYSLTNIVLHLYFTCVLTIYYYIDYFTFIYYGTKVVTNFSYNLNLAHLIQYSYIFIKHSHCYNFHVGVLFSLKLVYLHYYIVYICVRTGVINSLLFYHIYVKNTQPSKFVFILSVIKLSFNFYGTQIFCVNFVASKRM